MASFLRVLSFAAVSLAPCLALAEEPLSPAAPSTTVTVVLPPPPSPLAASTAWSPAPTPDTVVMHRRNTGVMIGGFAVTTAGIAALVGGVLLVDSINAKASACKGAFTGKTGIGASNVGCGVGDDFGRGFDLMFSWMLAIGGGAWTLGGITMSAIGGTMVPVKPKRSPKPKPKPSASATPMVSVGIGSMSASWSF